MVTYQTWTSVAFTVAESKGMETSQENNADLMSVAAEVWNDRKEELSTSTRSQAKQIAESEINIQ